MHNVLFRLLLINTNDIKNDININNYLINIYIYINSL